MVSARTIVAKSRCIIHKGGVFHLKSSTTQPSRKMSHGMHSTKIIFSWCVCITNESISTTNNKDKLRTRTRII